MIAMTSAGKSSRALLPEPTYERFEWATRNVRALYTALIKLSYLVDEPERARVLSEADQLLDELFLFERLTRGDARRWEIGVARKSVATLDLIAGMESRLDSSSKKGRRSSCPLSGHC